MALADAGFEPGDAAHVKQRAHGPLLLKISERLIHLGQRIDIRKQRVAFIEYFQWKDGHAADTEHQTPEVMAVWEPMGPVLEELTICEVEPL